MQEWTLGGYTFLRNPVDHSNEISLVGDNSVSLSGRVVSQPTALHERHSFKAIIYGRSGRLIDKVSLGFSNLSAVMYTGGKFYVGSSSGKVYIYDQNFNYTGTSLDVTGAYVSIKSLASDGTNLYYLTNPSSNVSWVYKMPLIGGAVQQSWQLPAANFNGITWETNRLWCMTDGGKMYVLANGTTTWKFDLTTQIAEGTVFKDCAWDGKYLWLNETSAVNKTFQITTTGLAVNSFPAFVSSPLSLVTWRNLVLYLPDGMSVARCEPNLVMADAYTIESFVKTGKFYMTDEFGVARLVSLTGFSVRRLPGYRNAIEVSLSVQQITR